MEQKYFTPDISDLKIGYEYQEFRGTYADQKIPEKYNDDSLWETKVIEQYYYSCGHCMDSDMGDLLSSLERGRIRTIYLTREQIEAEGWFANSDIEFVKGNWFLVLGKIDEETEQISSMGVPFISINTKGIMSNKFYTGPCTSINELRYIQKLLNIK